MADRKPTLSTNAHPNRTLGRYELIGEIASGGMGSVVLAKLAGVGGFQRLFAIKLLHKQYASDTEFVEMLLDEARIAARIQHPNVVGVQEVSESPDHGYYLVMDYVEGFPLWDIIQHMTVPPPGRWRITNRIIFDALNGLEAAHTLTDDDGTPLNVVHRDVSPQNILVSVDGIARVTDFGIAKAAARITSTRSGQLKGKLAYMAPEQAKGKKIDARTDVFAMGVVLWETLTLQRLFKRDSEAETYGQVLGGRIPPVREIAPTLPAPVDAVVLKALERDPDKRFTSARDMAQALEQATRAHNLMADAHEVGAFLRNTFATQLASRRAAIRTAATVTTIPPGQHLASLPGGLAVPQLAQERSGDIPAPGQAPAVAPGSGVQAAPNRGGLATGPGAPGKPPGPPPRPSVGNMPAPPAPPGPPARPSMAGVPAGPPRPPGAPPLPGASGPSAGPPPRPSMAGVPAPKPNAPPGPPGAPARPSVGNMPAPARPSVGNMPVPARPSVGNMPAPPAAKPAAPAPAPAAGNDDDWSEAKDTVIFSGETPALPGMGGDHDDDDGGGLGDDGPTMAMADADAPEELQAAIARAKEAFGGDAPRPAAGTPAVRPAAGVPSTPQNPPAGAPGPGPGPGPMGMGPNATGRAPSGTHNVPAWAAPQQPVPPGTTGPGGMQPMGPMGQGPMGMGPGPMGQGPMGPGPMGMGPMGMGPGGPRPDMTGPVQAMGQVPGMMPPQQGGWGGPQAGMGQNPYMEPGTSAIPLVTPAQPNATRWIVIALLVIGIGAGVAAVGIGLKRKREAEALMNAAPNAAMPTQPATTGGQ